MVVLKNRNKEIVFFWNFTITNFYICQEGYKFARKEKNRSDFYLKPKNIEWKQSLVKSIIYRTITLGLGTLTTYLITGSLALATGIAFLTEGVQAANYFVYELAWSNISRRKLEKQIIEKIKLKQIDLKLDYSSVKELAYQLSQIDTFVPDLYLTTSKIFKTMLDNEDLEEIHEEIEKYRNHFKRVHSGRKMFFLKKKEWVPKDRRNLSGWST